MLVLEKPGAVNVLAPMLIHDENIFQTVERENREAKMEALQQQSKKLWHAAITWASKRHAVGFQEPRPILLRGIQIFSCTTPHCGGPCGTPVQLIFSCKVRESERGEGDFTFPLLCFLGATSRLVGYGFVVVAQYPQPRRLLTSAGQGH